MKTKIILILIWSSALFSCTDEAEIKVFNKLSNVRLDNISYCDHYIGSYILPGETAKSTIVESNGDRFPFTGRIEFTMTSGDEKVFLQTKELYTLSKDQTLIILIDDDTEVINPQNQVLKISSY